MINPLRPEDVPVPPGHVVSPIKLKVRGDAASRIIFASFALVEDDTQEIPVGTLSMAVAEQDKQIYEEWVAMLQASLNRWTASVLGVEVAHVHRHRYGRPNN